MRKPESMFVNRTQPVVNTADSAYQSVRIDRSNGPAEERDRFRTISDWPGARCRFRHFDQMLRSDPQLLHHSPARCTQSESIDPNDSAVQAHETIPEGSHSSFDRDPLAARSR